MNHLNIAIELNKNKEVFHSMLHAIEHAQDTWKPSAEKWCLLEVVCHLHDEECEDFRARVQSVLQNPEQELAPIDPQGWVTSRKYMEQDYETVLQSFLKERERSVAYLNSLVKPMWDNAHVHPKFGSMTASLFLHNWLAHDYHHIRQINELKYLYFRSKAQEPLNYAGNW